MRATKERVSARIDTLEEERDRITDHIDELQARLNCVEEGIEATDDPNAAVDLRMERQAVEATLEDLQSDLEEVEEGLREARSEAEREEDVQALATLAEEAEEAMERFHALQGEILKALKGRASQLENAWSEWGESSQQFRQLLRKLEPGAYEPMTRHKDNREQRLKSARDLMARLQRGDVPVGAALSHAFVDVFDWTGLDAEDAAPKYASHDQSECDLLDAVLDTAPLDE